MLTSPLANYLIAKLRSIKQELVPNQMQIQFLKNLFLLMNSNMKNLCENV